MRLSLARWHLEMRRELRHKLRHPCPRWVRQAWRVRGGECEWCESMSMGVTARERATMKRQWASLPVTQT